MVVLANFTIIKMATNNSSRQQGHSKQSGWSGFGRTTISQAG